MPTCRKNILYNPKKTNFNINLDCCDDNNPDECDTNDDCDKDKKDECCKRYITPRICCINPCINSSLPLLTKCGLKRKKQLQHGITLINPCTEVYPNRDGKPCPNSRNPIRPVKSYNKKYSFNDELLLLKSNALNKSVYNCNGRCGAGPSTCPTGSCFN